MAETHDQVITLVAGEALVRYRRVKYHSTIGQVVYAAASDGDSWIGVTLPGPDGGDTASGDPVAVHLRCEGWTLKVECAAAVTKNAPLYPENSGCVSDDAGTVIIGTAAGESVGSGAASIIEMHPNGGSGSVPTEESVANLDSTTKASVGILLKKLGVTASGSTEIKKPARKLTPVLAWSVLRSATTATNVKIINATTDISAALAHATADLCVFHNLDDAATEIAASATLYVNLATTATAPGVDVYVLCQGIA